MATRNSGGRLALLIALGAILLCLGWLPTAAQDNTLIVEQTAEAEQPPVVLETPTDIPVPTVLPVENTPIVEATAEPTTEVLPTEEAIPTAEVTAEPTLAPLPLPPEPALLLAYQDTFVDALASAWSLKAGWSVIPRDADYTLRGTGSEFAELVLYDNLLDVAVQARVFIRSGAVQLTSRYIPGAGGYTAEVNADGSVTLYRGAEMLGSAVLAPAADGQYHTLRLSTLGDVIRVAVDGLEVIAVQDTVVLPPGSVAFASREGADFLVDDVALWTPADQPLPVPVMVVPVAPLPTAEATLAPEATVESTPEPMGGGTGDVGAMAANVYTVNSTNDNNDGVCDATHCSLREALTAANANVGFTDTIEFEIPGVASPFTIFPFSCKLPDIIDPLILDGYTQSGASPATAGAAAVIKIEIAGNTAQGGAGCPASPNGLTILAGGTNSIIRGIAITRFKGHGVMIDGADNVTLEGNFVGLEVEGSGDYGNTDGVHIKDAEQTIVGGFVPAARNIISGNKGDGIEVEGAGSIGTKIWGNYIGTDKSGLFAEPNTANGILLNNVPAIIGGLTAGYRNVISGNASDGIEISGAGANFTVVQGNYIGLSATGLNRVPNTLDGVYITGSGGNLIGGAGILAGGVCSGPCNVISGNGSDGIEIAPKAGLGISDNWIAGNIIGLQPNGTSLLTTGGITGNALSGIRINGVAGALIGTDGDGSFDPDERNIISGNQGPATPTGYGIVVSGISAINNLIFGNYIGTNTLGTAALGNGLGGILIQSPNTYIGGGYVPDFPMGPQYRNLISGNNGFGIEINQIGSTSNRIRGNYIGTTANGLSALANAGDGIRIVGTKNNFIGDGTSEYARNIISGNGGDGIEITGVEAEANRVQTNYIGVNQNNSGAVANAHNGVRITSGGKRNQIGLDHDDDVNNELLNNIIANNGQAGVAIEATAGTGNSVMNNEIVSNGGLGIDLGPTGVTLNDVDDADTGANNLQNYPVLTSVIRAGGNVTVQAILDSVANRDFRVDFFANVTCDVSGFGEGPVYLASAPITTDANGLATISKVIPDTSFPVGAEFFTMTVTEYNLEGFPEYSTSEFSKCIDRNNNPPSISDIPDQTTRGIVPVANIPFTVGDTETAAASLTFSFISSDTTMVPTSRIILGGSGANRTLTISAEPGTTPLNATPKTAIITVRVIDAGGSFNEDSFVFTVTPNAAPTVTPATGIANQTTPFMTAKGPLPLTVGDPDDGADILTLTALSDNLPLVPIENIVFGGSGANRTVTITPAAGQTGVANLTIRISDGDKVTLDTFSFTVSPNTVPTITAITNPQLSVTNTAKSFSVTLADAQTPVDNLTLSGTSVNTALIPDVNITFSGTGATRTVTLTPLTGQVGSSLIRITVSDGYMTAFREFTFTVNANVAPTISNIVDQTTTIATPKSVNFTVGDSFTPVASLVVTASSSNTTLLPNANIILSGTTATRTINMTPANGQAGTTTVTVTVSDGDLTSSDQFVLTVNPGPNSPPTISDIPAQSTTTNVPKTNIPFTVNDAQTPVGSLIVTGSSNNTTLVPNANITFGGSGADRTVTVTPATGQNGTATITVTVTDGGGTTASDTFVLTVVANTPPTISNIANQVTSVGTPLTGIPFTVNDAQTTPASLVVSGTSSNQTLIPNANIVFGGSGGNRTVNITPVAGQTGTATITVTVTDQGSAQVSDTFIVTVNPNTLPTITDMLDRYTTVGTATGGIPFTIGDFETPAAALAVSATSSNTTVIPNANITFGGSGANRTINLTPASGQLGSSLITVTVTDSHGDSSSDTFTVNVTTNNPPTISVIDDALVAPGTVAGPIEFTINDSETDPDDLTLSATSSNPVLVPEPNIVLGGVGGERTLTIFPASGQSGTANIIITVTDSANATASEGLVLTVRVSPPVLNTPANLSIVANVKPTFSWAAVTGAKGYTIQVDDTVNFSSALEINTNTTTPSYAAPNMLTQATYYWRVKALDAGGNDLTDWSVRPSFTINLLKTPANRSFTTDTTPTFTWGTAGTGVTYQLQVGMTPPTEPGFTPISIPCTPTSMTCTPVTPLPLGIYYWRVNVNGVPASAYFRVTISAAAPVAPLLTNPATGTFTNNPEVSLNWNVTSSIDGAPFTYEVQVDNQATFASPEFIQSGIVGPTPSVVVTPGLADGLYSWRVRAVNSLGVPGAWSLVRNFTVDTIDPAVPVLTAPVDGLVSNVTIPAFTWPAVPGAVQYKFDLATDSGFSTLVVNGAFVTTPRYAVLAANGLTNGTYYWRVSALDKANNESDYSLTRVLTINILKTPAHGTFTTDQTPTFTWSAVKPGATYQLQLTAETDTSFSSPITVPASCASTTATTCTLIASQPYGRYLWRVNVNGVNAPMHWLLIISPTAPAAPLPLFPASASLTNDNTPTMSWNPSSSTLGTPYTYEVQVDNQSTFASPEYTKAAISITFQTVNIKLADGLYYWRVRTVNAHGAVSTWSTTRTFTVDTLAPAAPVLKTPANNAILTDNTPALAWAVSTGATRYRVDISRNATFTDLAISGAQVTTATYTVPNAYALPDGIYYWRVRAIDAAGNLSGPSSAQVFRVAAP